MTLIQKGISDKAVWSMYLVQGYVILCLVLQKFNFDIDTVWTFSAYDKMVCFSLPLGFFKAV